MTTERVIAPADRCPCGKPQDASSSGYCSYECYSKHDLGAPIEPASSPASMGGPLGEAGWHSTPEGLASHPNALDQIAKLADWLTTNTGEPKASYGAVDAAINAMTEFRARVGVLEGQLATAREELAAGDASIVALSERCTAKGLELDRVIREAAADKARLAAVRDVITPRNPDWKPLTERHPEYFAPVSPEEAARKKGWGQGVELLTQRIKAALDGPTAAPEMPRPPAEETREPRGDDGGSTGVPEPEKTAQESESTASEGWTIARHFGRQVALYDPAGRAALIGRDLQVAEVLALISNHPSLPVPGEEA